LAHCHPPQKISCKSIPKFLHKVANRQTDSDEKITSLAEVIVAIKLLLLLLLGVQILAAKEQYDSCKLGID